MWASVGQLPLALPGWLAAGWVLSLGSRCAHSTLLVSILALGARRLTSTMCCQIQMMIMFRLPLDNPLIMLEAAVVPLHEGEHKGKRRAGASGLFPCAAIPVCCREAMPCPGTLSGPSPEGALRREKPARS